MFSTVDASPKSISVTMGTKHQNWCHHPEDISCLFSSIWIPQTSYVVDNFSPDTCEKLASPTRGAIDRKWNQYCFFHAQFTFWANSVSDFHQDKEAPPKQHRCALPMLLCRVCHRWARHQSPTTSLATSEHWAINSLTALNCVQA
jgi:hypothetical protein